MLWFQKFLVNIEGSTGVVAKKLFDKYHSSEQKQYSGQPSSLTPFYNKYQHCFLDGYSKENNHAFQYFKFKDATVTLEANSKKHYLTSLYNKYQNVFV
jgi:hypothetical protein